jgi:HEAT repeat protein
VNLARLFGLDKPNVKALARDGDAEGLIEAARYREVVRRVDGRISDAGASTREAAILALKDTADDRAGETLVRALGDPADRVRCAAILALYERRDDDALALAAAHLREEDGQALETAFRALLELEKPGSTHKLVSAIVHRDDERPVTETDASILRELLDAEGADARREVVDLLISTLGDTREDVAERSEDLLELLAPDSVASLVMELDSGLAPERAASVLGRIKDARALEPLVAALRHPDAQVRKESCVALGELRDPAASEPLLVATRDPEHLVRAGAGAALDRIGTAAIAVSVASLLRPLLEKAPAELVQALEADDPPLLEANGNGHGETENGFHTTLLRRFARFIDRIENARSGAPHVEPPEHVTQRAISTHATGARVISLPRELGNGHATPTRGKAAIPWPSSVGKSSASLPDPKAGEVDEERPS